VVLRSELAEADEAVAILGLLKLSNNRTLSILEQAAFIAELKNVRGLCTDLNGHTTVEIDLSRTRFMDCTGLGNGDAEAVSYAFSSEF
jgi:hypothetical protein